jgi:protein phosphatase
MELELHPPLVIHESGKMRMNYEFVYPKNPISYDQLFMVSAAKTPFIGYRVPEFLGERAAFHIKENGLDKKLDGALDAAVKKAAEELEDKGLNDYTFEEISNSLGIVHVSDSEIELGWMGDCRMYHVRSHNLLFRTQDHSKIQELQNAGAITEVEARKHEDKDVLSRYVGHGEMETHILEPLKAKDYIVMASRGIMEGVTEDQLLEILNYQVSNLEKRNLIRNFCNSRAKGNYTMIILQVRSVEY